MSKGCRCCLFALALWPLAAFAGATQPPILAKSFAVSEMAVGQSVTLTFTLTNPNPATDLTGVAFRDPLPVGLIVANPDSLVSGCDPALISTSVYDIEFSAGVLSANSSCQFSVDVYAVASGEQDNVTYQITSNESIPGPAATATVFTDRIFRDDFEATF